MRRRLILDASALIALGRLGLLGHTADHVGDLLVPDAVLAEASEGDRPGAVAVRQAVDAGVLQVVGHDPAPAATTRLGAGEAATIELADTLGAVAVLDDRDARRAAVRRDVALTGTVAILVQLRLSGAIASVSDQLDALERMGFRADPRVRQWALRAAGEG